MSLGGVRQRRGPYGWRRFGRRESGHEWGGRSGWGLVRGFEDLWDLGKEHGFYLNANREMMWSNLFLKGHSGY